MQNMRTKQAILPLLALTSIADITSDADDAALTMLVMCL